MADDKHNFSNVGYAANNTNTQGGVVAMPVNNGSPYVQLSPVGTAGVVTPQGGQTYAVAGDPRYLNRPAVQGYGQESSRRRAIVVGVIFGIVIAVLTAIVIIIVLMKD